MLVNQKLTRDGDKYILTNTVDVSAEIEAARRMNEQGGGRFGDKHSECVMLGHIPPAMWQCDPWLIAAKSAMKEGDVKSYQDYVKKFFQINSCFAVHTEAKYVQGANLL